ncbi:g2554 [Coccomyxa elongata]
MNESRNNVTAFLQHLAMNPDTAFSNRHDAKFISSGRLYELYKAFVESGDVYGRQMGKVNFGRRMNQMLPACLERKYVDGGQTREYKVPKSSDLEKMMREKGSVVDKQFLLHAVWNSASTSVRAPISARNGTSTKHPQGIHPGLA